MVAFTIAPATVELSSGSYRHSHNVQAGVSKMQHRLEVDKGMRVRIIRSNTVILDYTPDDYSFTSEPKTYNFNAFVAMYPR